MISTIYVKKNHQNRETILFLRIITKFLLNLTRKINCETNPIEEGIRCSFIL